jgi:hypothetical protein
MRGFFRGQTQLVHPSGCVFRALVGERENSRALGRE